MAESKSDHKKASTLKADRGRIDHHLRPLLGELRRSPGWPKRATRRRKSSLVSGAQFGEQLRGFLAIQSLTSLIE
jgi:hypothetical protein